MAKLFKTEYLSSETCPLYNQEMNECPVDCGGDCPSKKTPNFEVKVSEFSPDKTPFVIWDEDLDTILITERELKILADALDFDIAKKS